MLGHTKHTYPAKLYWEGLRHPAFEHTMNHLWNTVCIQVEKKTLSFVILLFKA